MAETDKAYRKRERAAKFQIWMGTRASRGRTPLDRVIRYVLCRVLDKALYIEPEMDFMQDDIIDADEGYSAEELERYQRGEDIG